MISGGMSLVSRIKGKAINAWLGPTGDAARSAVGKLKDRIAQKPRTLDVYFDIADPWSFLAGQAVERLLAAYPVELAFHVITPPASDVDPAPQLRGKYAVRDAQSLAAYWDVDFPGKKEPDPGMLRDIGTVLVRERPAKEQLAAAMELTRALWSSDKKLLVTLLGKWGQDSHGAVAPILNTSYADLRKAGHYQGAMIHWNGQWYWGVDRLSYLEAALAADLGAPVANVVKPRPEAERGAERLSAKPLACDFWFSFRSPYSYLALEQIEGVLAPHAVPLALRQVAPLVTRGLPMPTVKRLYIVRDAKREADRLGIPFGEICDPLGPGVTNCLAIQHFANHRGAGLAFARSAMRGIWSEARDVADYVDLRFIVERAELPWEEAKAVLDSPDGPKAAHENAADLNGIGLWGVPAFRVGDYVGWGQDRLPLLADLLRRHALATA